MARSALGKRTRASRETELDVPSKRIRRSTRSFSSDTENADPSVIAIRDENPEEEATAEITEESQAAVSITKLQPRKDVYQPLTPSTPRFRDALARVPVTPRHRIAFSGKTSKRLTPETPLTPSSVQTVYHEARQLFSRSADPGHLVGRDDERKQLKSFLERCSTKAPSGCIYVSGPPGTGKSATVNEVTTDLASSSSVKKIYVNCMSIKSSKDLYATLLDSVGEELEIADDDFVSVLKKIFFPRKKSSQVYLLVLDEIDHILSLDLESMYRIFEWSLHKASHLTLIGIANALDLTDRFLPRLKSLNLKPELLPFLPYSAAQIKNIITTRLKALVPEGEPLPFIHPAAIELCSRKVAGQTGDLRKAFEICRRAIDLVERETREKVESDVREKALLATPSRKVLGENNNLSSKGTSDRNASEDIVAALKALAVATAPRVTIIHLNKITAAAFSNGTNQRLKTLNLQQKAALCSLVALEKRNRASKASVLATPSKSHTTAPSIKRLYDTYCQLCTQDSVLHPLSSSEFREVIDNLETLSLVSAVDGKTGSFSLSQTPSKRGRRSAFGASVGLADRKRVASCVGEKEMEAAVEGLGAGILKSILSGEALD